MTNKLEVEGQRMLFYNNKADYPWRFPHAHAIAIYTKANLMTVMGEIEKNR
jgi:hypothetical protein